MAQQRAVWATRKDGGKGHPDNKKKTKKEGTWAIPDNPRAKKELKTLMKKPLILADTQIGGLIPEALAGLGQGCRQRKPSKT